MTQNFKKMSDIEVIIQKDGVVTEKTLKKFWSIEVKFINKIDKNFTFRIRNGSNLISKNEGGWKEYLQIKDEGRYNGKKLIHWYESKNGEIGNLDIYKLTPIIICDNGWFYEGLKISEDGKIIWWLLELKKKQDKKAGVVNGRKAET